MFDPATIYATVDDNTFTLYWDSEQEYFTDKYKEYRFTMGTVFNAPIICIDSKQGYGNTLFAIVKLW